jgi:hypothetical protein
LTIIWYNEEIYNTRHQSRTCRGLETRFRQPLPNPDVTKTLDFQDIGWHRDNVSYGIRYTVGSETRFLYLGFFVVVFTHEVKTLASLHQFDFLSLEYKF